VSYIIGAAWLASTPVRKWNEEFRKQVGERGKEDKEYQQA